MAITWHPLQYQGGATREVIGAYDQMAKAVDRGANNIADYFAKTLVDREKRIKDEATDMNTADLMYRMNSQDSLESLQLAKASGMFDPGNLERAYGGNWDRKAYTEAYKNWAKDTNARFIENDNLKMSNPATQKAYQDALAAYANNDIPKLKEIMSAHGGNFSMKIAEALAGHGRTMFDKERANDWDLKKFEENMRQFGLTHAINQMNAQLGVDKFNYQKAQDAEAKQAKRNAFLVQVAEEAKMKVAAMYNTDMEAGDVIENLDKMTKQLAAELGVTSGQLRSIITPLVKRRKDTLNARALTEGIKRATGKDTSTE